MKKAVLLFIFFTVIGINAQSEEKTYRYIELGDSCMEQLDIFHAIACYKSGYDSTDNDELKRKIAKCYRMIGDNRTCISWLNKIPSPYVTHSDMRLYYYSYESLEIEDSTLYWGNKITNEYPFDSKIVASFSSFLNKSGYAQQADSLARAYVKNDSSNLFVNRQLGYSCYLLKNYKEALDIYRNISKKGIDNFETNFIIGYCYEELDSLNQAYNYMLKAVKHKKEKDFNSLYRLGLICLNSGIADEALTYLNRTLNILQPDKNTMYNLYKNIGASYFKLMKYKEAGTAFETCLDFIPNDIVAYYNAAQMFYANKDIEKAKSYLQKIIELSELNISDTNQEIIDNAKKQLDKW